MMSVNKDVVLSELAALFGRLVIAERNHDSQTVGFANGVVGEEIASAIERLADRDVALVGLQMSSYSRSLARLAIVTRGDRKRRPLVDRQLGEHINVLTRLVRLKGPMRAGRQLARH